MSHSNNSTWWVEIDCFCNAEYHAVQTLELGVHPPVNVLT